MNMRKYVVIVRLSQRPWPDLDYETPIGQELSFSNGIAFFFPGDDQ